MCPLTLRGLLAAAVLVGAPLAGQDAGSVYTLTLEELSQLRVPSGASLTGTELEKAPGALTIITERMIARSGARNLDELLEVYVPNLFTTDHVATARVFGIRGIIAGRAHKTLILVNGRVTNQRMLLGAVSERNLPLLDDIRAIEVLRGPGSAIHGPGGLNGVINILTHTGATFEGLYISAAQGLEQRFTLAEARYGRRFGSSGDIFVYYGIDEVQGADPEDSPLYFSRSNGDLYGAEVPIDTAITNNHGAMEGAPHHKAHLDLRLGGTRIWGRLVRGSNQFMPARREIDVREDLTDRGRADRYQHVTAQITQRVPLGAQTSLRAAVGYDVLDYIRDFRGQQVPDFDYSLAMRERELSARALLDWSPGRMHSVVLGLEYYSEWFGESPTAFTDDASHNGTRVYEPWRTDAWGAFGEYQWNPSDRWTLFAGGRLDRHSYTEFMASPRFAVVWTPAEGHSTKFLVDRSVRRADDVDLRSGFLADPGFRGTAEEATGFELRHEVRRSSYTASIAPFLNDVEILSWVAGDVNAFIPTGDAITFGLEAEGEIRRGSWQIAASYAFTKLLDYRLADEGIRNQNETSAPYGYGNDLQNWPRHTAKAHWRGTLTPSLDLTGSVRMYWGFQGALDYARYNVEELQQPSFSSPDPGREVFASGNAFLTLGLTQKLPGGFEIQGLAHNLLGWLSPTLNKRNRIARMDEFRIEAPSASIRIRWQR